MKWTIGPLPSFGVASLIAKPRSCPDGDKRNHDLGRRMTADLAGLRYFITDDVRHEVP